MFEMCDCCDCLITEVYVGYDVYDSRTKACRDCARNYRWKELVDPDGRTLLSYKKDARYWNTGF